MQFYHIFRKKGLFKKNYINSVNLYAKEVLTRFMCLISMLEASGNGRNHWRWVAKMTFIQSILEKIDADSCLRTSVSTLTIYKGQGQKKKYVKKSYRIYRMELIFLLASDSDVLDMIGMYILTFKSRKLPCFKQLSLCLAFMHSASRA